MNDYTLYDFQVRSVNWLETERTNGYGFTCAAQRGLIGHEMGLGKTAISLAALRKLVESGKRFLFLVPGQTITQWQKQWNRWIQDNEIDEFGGNALCAIRGTAQHVPYGCSVVMSHSLLAKAAIVEKLAPLNFDGIVIDEIHKFGTQGTKRCQHLWALINLSKNKCAEVRIGLSGTMVRNYAREIYNIAHFLDAENPSFRTYESFKRKYLSYDERTLWNPQQFHSDFSPYVIRYTTAEVQKDLPAVRRFKLYTEITDPFIKSAYNKQLDLLSNFVNNSGKVEAFSLLGYLIKLRHITGIGKAKEPAIIDPIRDFLLAGDEVSEPNRKCVIGIHHRFVADRLQTSLPEFKFFIIRGGMTDREKEAEKNAFIAYEGHAICLLSIKAAAEGIDGLQFAAYKIYTFERQWNGADELQFEKRVHRTGQTRLCISEITIATGTIDEYYDELVDYKRRITTQVEDENFETNPAFLRQLAEKVIASRL